mmetsp:Transcript_6889/g.11457  ORF Transcript_6889/g.11457 Transcript_6889/m.11457 type:complete len:293 (+) Transcript_6889:67-945(+)
MEPQAEGSVDVPAGTTIYSAPPPSLINTMAAPASKEPAPQSKYRGVCWVRANQKWKAQITIDGKQAYLGLFDSEEEAARKVDEHAAGLGRPSNFASVGKKKVPSAPSSVSTVPVNTAPPRDPAPQSKYRGVSWIRANQKWKAQITIDGKQTYLGLFESEVEAAFAYDEHASQMGKPVNFATQEGQKQATPSKRKRIGDEVIAPAALVPLPPMLISAAGAPILPNTMVMTAMVPSILSQLPASAAEEAESAAPAIPPAVPSSDAVAPEVTAGNVPSEAVVAPGVTATNVEVAL